MIRPVSEFGIYDEKEEYDDFYVGEKEFFDSTAIPRDVYVTSSLVGTLLGCRYTSDPTTDCYGAQFVPSNGV